MKKFKLKLWEKILIVLSLLLFLISFVIYISGFPIRNYLFGIQDIGGQVKVGALVGSDGSVRRQIDGEAEFKAISPVTTLYNMDVIVTGRDSTANLHFDNGVTVAMTPSTMVRLDFLSDFSLDNISRLSKLEVFSGSLNLKTTDNKVIVVSSKTASTVDSNSHQAVVVSKGGPTPIPIASSSPSPSPSPSPLASSSPSPKPSPRPTPKPSPSPSPSPMPRPSPKPKPKPLDPIRLVSSVEEKSCVLDPADQSNPSPQLVRKGVMLSWTTGHLRKNTFLSIWKVQDSGSYLKILGPLEQKTTRSLWLSRSPGRYIWRVSATSQDSAPMDQDLATAFTVTPECHNGIKMLPPLVGGMTNANSNRLTGSLMNDFNVTLRWEPISQLSKYQVWFGKSHADKSALLEKTVEKSEFTFNKNKIFTGRLYYQVSGHTPNGFIMTSGLQEFVFVFLPPELVTPDDAASITLDEIKKEKNSLLITWEKTNFTTGYELEVAKDAGFKNIYIKRVLKENFLVVQAPAVGQYWWRVRSFTEDISSKMSAPHSFTIAPK